MKIAQETRHKAIVKSIKSEDQEIKIHSAKNPPTLFDLGDEVLVQLDNKKANKVKGKGVSVQSSVPCPVTEWKPDLNKYKVKVVDVQDKQCEQWVSVNKMTSMTRGDKKSRKKNIGDGMILH